MAKEAVSQLGVRRLRPSKFSEISLYFTSLKALIRGYDTTSKLLQKSYQKEPYTLSFNFSQFEFSIENGYDRVRGIEMSATTDTGAPELPVKSLNFILPNGNRVQNKELL